MQSRNWVASLRRAVQAGREPVEHCELCEAAIPTAHQHVVEPESRRLLCACQACALLFDSPNASHYRRVPQHVERLDAFRLEDGQWDAFRIPINLAFFHVSSTLGHVVAMYPGPAGATESALNLDAWGELLDANPVLAEFEPDVEALLVNRMDGARDYYRIPVDRCYELVGLLRAKWHGLSGGREVGSVLSNWFQSLESGSSPGMSGHA